MTPLQAFRTQQLRSLPARIGVYALCDLDEVPIYVGQSTDGIRQRVRRHLTSARSDVVANRQIDVWEVAHVWGWPVDEIGEINELEAMLYHQFDRESRLMNGTIPAKPRNRRFREPDCVKIQILPNDEIASRKRPEHRLPRQIAQFNQLMDYILIVKDVDHLRSSLQAHFERLSKYYAEFTSTSTGSESE